MRAAAKPRQNTVRDRDITHLSQAKTKAARHVRAAFMLHKMLQHKAQHF
jgi:hypothetical protein